MTTDYSLQVAFGIRNFYQALRAYKEYVTRLQKEVLAMLGLQNAGPLPVCSRDGDDTR
jgi:hypothetical protein